MIRRAILLSSLVMLAGCDDDETLRSYGAANKVWRLVEMNGHPFAASATLTLPAKNQIVGNGPCNEFHATLSVPYPWFAVENFGSTKIDCPALAEESQYFDALSKATLSEVLGNTLILSTPDGPSLIFTADG